MPTPRIHTDAAARQRAYRHRQAGTTTSRPPPTRPGPARWRRLITLAQDNLTTTRQEMEEWAADRSDRWQDSDAAETHQARIDALDAALSELHADALA